MWSEGSYRHRTRRWWNFWASALARTLVSAPSGHAEDFTGPVDIGGGRSLFLDCQGEGSPGVFVIPGKGSYAEVWNAAVPPNDPIRSSP